MNDQLSPRIAVQCLKMSFPRAGRYRVMLRFSSTPASKTAVALCCNESSTLDSAYLPLFNAAQMDITVAEGPAVFFACHSALREIHLVKSPEHFSAYSLGSIFGRIYKKSFLSGNMFRIRRVGSGILTFVSRHAERQNQVRAIWNEIAEDSYYSSSHSMHHAVPTRHSKPWRTCLIVSVTTKKEILAALKLQPSVDQLVLVIVKSDLTENEKERIPADIEVIFAEDTNDVYSALLRACRTGRLSSFEFVGLCLRHRGDELEHQRVLLSNDSDPSSRDEEILFGSKNNIRSIMSVFESDSKIGMIQSPLMSMFRQLFADQMSASSRQLISSLRSAWFRVKSLEAILPMMPAEDGRIHSAPRPQWPALVEQSLTNAGFTTTSRLWADLRNGEPADAADFRVFRPLTYPQAKKVCLFVCFAPNGELRPHALHFMRELRRIGYLVLALAANDQPDLETRDPGPETCDGLAARENVGYDFALWAAALIHDPRLFDAEELLLVNDSLIGPLLPIDGLFANIESTNTDVVGLVDSYQHNYHCQSFFLLLRKAAIKNDAFVSFINNVKSFSNKNEVIRKYEQNFYSIMASSGLSFNIQFATARFGKGKNPTIQYWRELLALGFPFIKLQLVQMNPLMDDLSDMVEILSQHADKEHVEASFLTLKADHPLR